MKKKLCICVESSHQKGLGHLFRGLNMIEALIAHGGDYLLLLNDDQRSVALLQEKGIKYALADLTDTRSDWETGIIKGHNIDVWINDRLDTKLEHASNVKKNKCNLISFDDQGGGAELADINFAGLPFNFSRQLKGKKVCCGTQYLVLNKQIDDYKRQRKTVNNIVVTIGGTDTYGVTIKVVEILKQKGLIATIIVGPGFEHDDLLKKVVDERYQIKRQVPSLIEAFSRYDLAITGGGITPFEANASGLPCIIVANEKHEIPNGEYLAGLGSSLFAGFHEDLDVNVFASDIDIESMSAKGLSGLRTDGADNILKEIDKL